MTVDVTIGLFDRVLFGLPYHGLWRGGQISLPNGSTIAAPAPASSACILMKVPGKLPVKRSASELAADAVAGREWRNYGLLSGGRYGSVEVPNITATAAVILIDDTKQVWRLKIAKGLTNKLVISAIRLFRLTTTPAAWTSSITIDVPPDYYAHLYQPLTIAQSSSGREFILSSKMGGIYPNVLMQVNVSGTLNPDASDLGLSFTTTMIEWPGRTQYLMTDSVTVSGTNRDEQKLFFRATNTNTGEIAGPDFVQTRVYVDDALQSDTGAPPWDPDITYSYYNSSSTHTTTKTYYERTEYAFSRIIFAAYVGDDKKFLTVEFSNSTTVSATPKWGDSPNFGGPDQWWWAPENSTSVAEVSSIFKYGGVEISVNEKSSTSAAAPAGGMGERSSTTTNVVSPTVTDALVTSEYYNYFPVGDYREYPTVRTLNTVFGGWVSPVIVKGVEREVGATHTIIPDSVWAPTGTSVATSLPYNQLYASWQPMTDQIAVDSQLICWF